jgi:DNA polymerase-4
MTRKILLADLDAFFASVEQRDKPALRGKPVIVCGYNNRGVVAAASYEARAFGIHSAMPVFQAKKLCPKGYYVVPDFEKYERASHQVYEIFYNYTDIVEGAGLDEAYLDVTINKKGIPSALWIAQDIRYEVFRETGLTLSVGVAPNKLVAKIACDFNKPNGITVVAPEQVKDFLKDLPVGKIPGIGPRTESICWSFSIKKISDFLKFDEETLGQWFGSSGPYFRLCAQGIDNRQLSIGQERKSCGIEDTFGSDILD